MTPTTIYGLLDCAGTVRYVGATLNPRRRLRVHANTRAWVAGTLVLEVVPAGHDWRAAERRHIAEWGKWGDLENQNAGGSGPAQGVPRGPITPERRAKISAARKGSGPLSPEHRAKLSAALKGRSLSPEHRANISRGRKGIRLSPEHHAKLQAGRWRSSLAPAQPSLL